MGKQKERVVLLRSSPSTALGVTEETPTGQISESSEDQRLLEKEEGGTLRPDPAEGLLPTDTLSTKDNQNKPMNMDAGAFTEGLNEEFSNRQVSLRIRAIWGQAS